MKYTSTQNNKIAISGIEAIARGLSKEGGLFVPQAFPKITKEELYNFIKLSYPERAANILEKFLPELKGSLLEYSKNAYSKFDEFPCPLVKISDEVFMLELWHGPTYAFKDMALTILPYLLTGSKQALNETTDTIILAATSGDTGKAALEGFKDVKGTSVIALYPSEGVSELQKKQMQTQEGSNVAVYGIKGNFDDAQNIVKEIFTSKQITFDLAKKGYSLSSANSINIGRLIPQIVYYFSSYADMLEENQIQYGSKVNFCVPTGNFGNILACYYAKKMGLPVNKLICASNKNNVLTDFFQEGEYNTEREFYKTSSPSMDILVSSNLERLLFEILKRDSEKVSSAISSLKENKKFSVTDSQLKMLQEEFFAQFATDSEAAEIIKHYFDEHGYIVDTHTAVALCVYQKYVDKTKDETKTVIVSTASPYKFSGSVLSSLNIRPSKDEGENVKKLLLETALPIPSSLERLFTLSIKHNKVLEKGEVVKEIFKGII